MKKITLIISLIIITYSAYSQNIPINDGFQFKFPNGSVKISATEFSELRQKMFNKETDTIGLNSETFFKKDRILSSYKKVSMPASFRPPIESRIRNSINLTKKYNKETVIEDDKVITINGLKISIVHYNTKGYHRVLFATDYNKESQFISGLIEFNDADKDEAKKYLDEVLQSMKQNN